MDTRQALALLEWQIELGADEAIENAPVNRYELSPPKPAPAPATIAVTTVPSEAPAVDAVAEAEAADGRPEARVMIIGEAPGRDEDLQGRPFVGRAGQLLDQMFAAIDMARDAADTEAAIYITNILPWRPPENRNPTPEEIAMLMPFVRRHVELAAPEVIVAMGNISCLGLLGRKGITRMRGVWDEALGRPVLPMFHPAYLLRSPHEKRKAWHDLLALRSRLRTGG